MTDWLTDVASVLDGLEEILEVVSGDGRLLSYARDLTRLVGWVRTQPRARGLVLGALGAGLLVGAVLLSTHGEPVASGQARAWSNLPVAEPPEPDPEEEDWR
jgi:hypothetical protein